MKYIKDLQTLLEISQANNLRIVYKMGKWYSATDKAIGQGETLSESIKELALKLVKDDSE